ncbi:putative trichohyalin, partial [Toxoplasma gondii CAST]
MLSHHSPYDMKTPAKAARVVSKTQEQLRSSWKNTIFSESPVQKAHAEALMSYGVSPLSVDILVEKRERVVAWLKAEVGTLFNKCGDPGRPSSGLSPSHARQSLQLFQFSSSDLVLLQSLFDEVCEAIRTACSHITVKKELPSMTTPMALSEKDAASVTK